MTNTKSSSKSQSTTNLNQLNESSPVENSPGQQAWGELSTGRNVPPIFITPYGPHRRVRFTSPTEGRTKQSFKAECDINTIMARYLKTGLLEHVRTNVAQFIDVTGADFQDAANLVAEANSMFHSLPSSVRTKFENSPARFLEFMENPANAQEAIEMGLATARPDSSTPPSQAPASVEPDASSLALAASQKPLPPDPGTKKDAF